MNAPFDYIDIERAFSKIAAIARQTKAVKTQETMDQRRIMNSMTDRTTLTVVVL
jgi:hypothetical protein